MGEKQLKFAFATVSFCLLVFLGSCISLPRSLRSQTYRKQKIYLSKTRFYRVGPLSQEWQETSSPKKAGIYFHNKMTGANIATETICGSGFEDLPLNIMTEQLLAGLQNVRKQKQEDWMLSNRGALYSIYSVSLDGVLVQLNITVIKKNRCQFDFWAVSRPAVGVQTSADFESFVKGFDY